MSITANSENAIASYRDQTILCFHTNTTRQVQVIRILNNPNFKFERVVFPGQRLMFEAVPGALLELCTPTNNYFIPCQELGVKEFP